MATLVKVIRTPKFNLGDKVQFKSRTTYDNYSPGYRDMYGYASKINKVTMNILGVDGERYIANISEVKKYVDPFEELSL
jgi:hypothetical protein